MDFPLEAPKRDWRRATLVAATIAGVELVLLVVCGFLLLGKTLLPSVETAAKREAAEPVAVHPVRAVAPAPVKTVAPPRQRARTHVLVLNGNGQTGAAASAAQLVQARGYPAAETGDADRTDYARSIVMYAPTFRREATRFARDLNVRVVTPLDGIRERDLNGAQLVYVVGRR